ncbi:MAG: NAD-dependent epimerase/dehydratase family protein, partial [Myxococcales bacterium]|nr:NAD-dependent epimerase/dehydratase family protein [Myxococcales bacterium]
MSRFFLTGATGFLGRHLSALLRERGHEVVALCRGAAPDLAALGVNVQRGDVLDLDSVRAAAHQADGAFHCAGLVSRARADAEKLQRLNVDGTKIVLLALEQAGVPRVVVASTSGTIAVSARATDVLDESAPSPLDVIARWPYYRSKLFGEEAALALNKPGFEVVCVNPSLLLGPGDVNGSSTEDVRKFLERKIPFCPAGGIAFVDARDAARGMLQAFERGEPGARYLLNGANMSLAVFFGRLERISGVKAPALRFPRTSARIAGVSAELLGKLTS